MQVDLLQARTSDGVRLHGAYHAPADPAHPTDTVICVHGTGSNFYSSALFDELAAPLLSAGIGVLRVNTRGHDLMCSDSGRRLGAAYEVVDHCTRDLAAWVALARERFGPRVALVGHSLGAVKCLYAQARPDAEPVRAVVAISPPRLSHSLFRSASPEFVETYQRARALVDAGEPDALLDVRFPMPFVTTAAGYVEKYGPDERYNYLTFLARVRVPVLVTLGELEIGSPAFRGSEEAVRQAAPAVRFETFAAADHNYGPAREQLGRRIADWLRECPDERRSQPPGGDPPTAGG